MTEWVTVNMPWANSKESEVVRETEQIINEFYKYADTETALRFGPRPKVDASIIDFDIEQLHSDYPGLRDARTWTSSTELDQFVARCNNPIACQIAHLRFYLGSTDKFIATDPTCLEYRSKIDISLKKEKQGQFRYHPACKPGVVIEVQDPYKITKRLVIGDVNAAGFVGDEYQIFDESDIVLRYLDLTSFYLDTQDTQDTE